MFYSVYRNSQCQCSSRYPENVELKYWHYTTFVWMTIRICCKGTPHPHPSLIVGSSMELLSLNTTLSAGRDIYSAIETIDRQKSGEGTIGRTTKISTEDIPVLIN